MKLYERLTIPGIENLMAQARAYATSSQSVMKMEARVHLIPIPLDDALRQMPALDLFRVLGLTVNRAYFYVIYENNESNPHSDEYPQDARINVPVLNCEQTYLQFWEGVKTYDHKNPLGFRVKIAVPGSGRVCDRVELIQPTVFRVNTIHNVVMENPEARPRITLSLGFDRCPSFLLE
jgi:hypothetical protein